MWPSTRTSLSLTVCVLALCFLAGLGATGLGMAGVQPAADAGTSAAVQPEPADDLDLPERVVLSGSQTSGSTVVEVDAGAAVDRGGSQLEGAYERYLLEERLAAAENDEERREILRETVARINQSAQDLRQRERNARSEYRNGNTDERTYLASLGSINNEAEQLETLAEVLDPIDPRTDGIVDEYDATEASRELDTVRGDIIAHRGPVRSRIGEIVAGERSASRVYITVAPNGSVLSTVDGGEFHREAIRTDLLVSGTEQGISLTEAYDLASAELYPRYESQFTSVGRGVSRQFYRVLGEGGPTYSDGSLRSYIDAVSQDVFWEYQRLGLSDDLPRASPITNASGGVELSVRPTYGTGPASVQVAEGGTAASNVSVSVDDEVVAETDGDGVAWIVVPNDGATVAVTTGGETVEIDVDP